MSVCLTHHTSSESAYISVGPHRRLALVGWIGVVAGEVTDGRESKLRLSADYTQNPFRGATILAVVVMP